MNQFAIVIFFLYSYNKLRILLYMGMKLYFQNKSFFAPGAYSNEHPKEATHGRKISICCTTD